MIPEIEPIVRDLEENRRLMAEVLERLSQKGVNRVPREGQYSPRQTLAHLAGAERGMTRLMQLMASGEKPRLKPEYDNDYYNLRQQEKRAKLSVEDISAELVAARRDLLAFMERLKPEDLVKVGEHPTLGDTNVLEVLKQLQSHERAHIEEMGLSADD